MSATMADDQQHLLWRENRGDDDHNKMSDFPHNFISYVNNNQFLCDRGIFNRGFVFSTLQQHHPPSQPPPFSKIIDLDSETQIAANQELIGKIESIMKWIVFCPGQFLVQFWKVIEIGGRPLLTTQDQPFGLSTTHEGLCSYRLISPNDPFYVDGVSEADLGLPGRVFQHRRPESSPNVPYSSCEGYPQRDHDVISKVRRSWALPVLESSGQCCVGVLELVAAAEPKYPFANLIDGIYKRVEEVGLRSSETCNHLYNKHNKYEDEALKDALAEIKKVLIEVCKSHDLPLAQTWVPCRLCNPAVAGGSFNVSCREHLMSRFDIACCRDKDKFPFVDVCTLHSLGKGQGVVGKAFLSHNLVFCKDITQFSIIEYPLAHYACKYGLTRCFSICLRSSYTGDNVYVLEFFLRPSNTEGGDPRIALVPLLTTLKKHFRSFTVASGEELGEELCVEVIDSSKKDKLDSFQIPQIARSPDMMKNGGEMDYVDLSDQQLIEEDVIDTRNNVVCSTEINNIVVTSLQQKCIINSSQRQQRKAGIPISFEDIQQHVGMKLDDAAASLPGKAKGVLFEDDGDGYEFTRGGYLLTTYVAELESSVVTVRISETEGSWKRPKRRLHVQLLLGGCAMLDAWGIDGEVLQIMMPSEDEVSNLVSMSEKQYKIRMENAKRIPEVEKVSGRKGVELSRTPIELKNGVWALKVVPWFGGRIISMEHLPSGTQWLHSRVEVDGYEEFSGTEYRSAGWSEEYTVIERNLEQAGERESLMLEGDIGGGVVIERHISFPKDNSNILRIDSSIVASKVGAGSGGFSRLVCLRVHPLFALLHPTETYVSITSVNGSHHEVWPESGEKFFEGDLRPNGEWMLVDRCLGLGLVNRFNVSEVNKCFIHWGTGTVNLELWSDDKPVSKQSPLKISHEYEVRGIAS